MTYTKLFTVLAAVICSVSAYSAKAADYSRLHENPSAEDSLKFKVDAPLLTPEELALLVEYIPNEPNEVIADRLSCIEATIPLTFNSYVRSFIDYFTIRNRKYTRNMLTRENVYFPLFEKYLAKYNMPQDLKYLSIVESGLYPKAASRVGAVGLWQFMPGTGKDYGLSQNQYFDERMDPEKSTEAAMKFLRRLYKMYDDWELAMAAYNCGPGNVNRAIRKAGGGKKTFWEIFPYLPKETRGYIPSMTAVIYAMKYAPEHNIFSDSILYATEVDTMLVSRSLDLEKLAVELQMEPEALLALNPEIKKTVLPAHVRKYPLRIPAQRMALVAKDRSCILLAAAPASAPVIETSPEKPPVLLATAKGTRKEAAATPAATPKKKAYLVQRGDNLLRIADKHHVTVAQLKEWNHLKGSNIRANQELVIYQAEEAEATALLASNTTAPAEATAGKDAASQKAVEPLNKNPSVYHVQPGDTLWTISQRYKGMTVEQLKKLNKLKSNEIKPGQKLIVS
ncbi:LysM peptidoglycan-binding domain-containing protein [Pontibacter sp. 172403-2]|uniref:lytic transglycosylase domain-containing protein n=1 Tax=Pontibacter rufus TaxID=2791028 RepID=UPI0018AF969D|nr:lytic transglycosylase domain-containing protein [Pontibacter sp. 172403-2]MBF9253524.1 LysM peptidoglycan-binding domain-containing protein [Pontibacter sp. 172403-2]